MSPGCPTWEECNALHDANLKERDAKLAEKQSDSLSRFMSDLAVSGPQPAAGPSWNEEMDEEDEEEETEDIYGDDPRLLGIRRAQKAKAGERGSEFCWPRPG